MRYSEGKLMSDEQELEPQVEAPEGNDQGGENPAWNGIKELLPPTLFDAVKPELSKWDKNYQSSVDKAVNDRIEKDYGWAKGITPEYGQQAIQIAQSIEGDPAAVWSSLGKFLKENGRMPETPEELQEVEDDAEEADPRDQQIQELQAQVQGLSTWAQNSTQEQMNQAAEADLEQQITNLQKAHPELSNDDMADILGRATRQALMYQAQGIDKAPTLEEAFAEFDALRNRILGAPRAGASAPRLLPTGGGVPAASAGGKSLGQQSSSETQDLVSRYLDSQK